MTTPYRTAPATTAPRAPWWRRALCAVGSHELYLVSSHHARCEHCAHETRERLYVTTYLDAFSRTFTRHRDGKSTPDEERFIADYYRTVRNEYVTD